MKTIVTAAAACLMAAAGIAGTHVTAANARALEVASPRSLALTVRDLPAGYKEITAFARTDAQADKLDKFPSGTLERRGRVSSYETDFRRAARSGIFEIQDNVVSYRSVAGVQWQFNYSVGLARKRFKGSQLHQVAVGSIGDQSFGYQWTGVSKGVKLTVLVVLIRRKTYGANLVASAYATGFKGDDVLRLAHLLDNRLRSAK